MTPCYCILLITVICVLVSIWALGADSIATIKTMRTERLSNNYAYESSWGDNVEDGAVWRVPSVYRSTGPLIEMLPPEQLL